jgi:hypothetical protein
VSILLLTFGWQALVILILIFLFIPTKSTIYYSIFVAGKTNDKLSIQDNFWYLGCYRNNR